MNTIVIQFIGIILFTGQDVPTLRERVPVDYKPAVNPAYYRLAAPVTPQIFQLTRYQVTAVAPSITDPNIDPHKAIILFKSKGFCVSGWTVKGPTLADEWSYVELDHDAVEFVSDKPNPAVGRLSNLQLPKVSRPDGKIQMQNRYMTASNPETAAVFTISNGTLEACAARDRVDTNLRLSVEKNLTIKSGNKTLTLPATAQVVVANVPFSYVNNPTAFMQHGTTAHWKAYCAVLGVADCAMSAATPQASCNYFIPGTGKTSGNDFACSNTQWP